MRVSHSTIAADVVRTGLIGSGIGPSLSPALHEREAAALGLPLRYARWDLDVLGAAPEEVGGLLAAARDQGYRGVNVTHPCKQVVIGNLDALSPDAAAIGAVNTVVIGEDGSFTGHNTDWTGFRDGLRDGLPGAGTGRVVLLGAGGAGAAAGYALVREGVRRLQVVDVDADRAQALAGALAAMPGPEGPRATAPGSTPVVDATTPPNGVRDTRAQRGRPSTQPNEVRDTRAQRGRPSTQPIGVRDTRAQRGRQLTGHGRDELADLLPGADGVVHATPVGMAAHPGLPFDAGLLATRPWVAEIVYRPLDTALLRAARTAGCRTVDGGRMAVHQAAEAFRLFTGRSPDPARMLAHLAELVEAEADRVA